MIDINLLPWREEEIKAKNIIFGIMAGMVILGCLGLCSIVSLYMQRLLNHETEEVVLLSQEISMLEGKIKTIKGLQERQNLLLSKRNVIQALQASRPFIVKVFEDIVKTVPDGIFLLAMDRKGNRLTLEGISNSNSRISVFMNNLEQLSWLNSTTLQEIKTQDSKDAGNNTEKNKQVTFQLQGDIAS